MSLLRLPAFKSPLPESRAYVLEAEQGETKAVVGSGSIMRFLTTGKETNDAFAVVQTRGREDDVVPAHFHREAHDVFFVTAGQLKLYLGDQVRVLSAGDFASAPPTVPHAYQILTPDTEFVGLITPGSWTEFFNYIGEEFDLSPLYPALDNRPFPVHLMIEAIKAGKDVIPLRDYDYSAANSTAADAEHSLPGKVQPYYLRASSGPSWLLGNQSCSPLITTSESGGRFSIVTIACIGSSFPGYEPKASPTRATMTLPTDMLARGVEGKIRFDVDGSSSELLTAKESIFVPANTKFSYEVESAYAKMYVFGGAGRGLGDLFYERGRKVEGGAKHEVLGESDEWKKPLA